MYEKKNIYLAILQTLAWTKIKVPDQQDWNQCHHDEQNMQTKCKALATTIPISISDSHDIFFIEFQFLETFRLKNQFKAVLQ